MDLQLAEFWASLNPKYNIQTHFGLNSKSSLLTLQVFLWYTVTSVNKDIMEISIMCIFGSYKNLQQTDIKNTEVI